VFPDAEFADLFPSGKDRPSIPAPVAASILTLQTLLDYSDAQTAEARPVRSAVEGRLRDGVG
jgi:hypothetical protein